MKEYYLGVDVGSISTKGVIIDKNKKIVGSSYIWTEGNPVRAVTTLINNLEKEITKGIVRGIGTTGSARKLIGLMLGANVVKNEITAHAIGTLEIYPQVRTILEIGGQDSKMIIIDNGAVVDYSMNTLCAAGTGSFLTSQAKRLGIPIEEFGEMALMAESPVKIASRCTVFAESDLIHKAGLGYCNEDIIAGLCKSIVLNYLNNVGRGHRIEEPIVFQGGVSKNKGVLKYFEEVLGQKINVDENGHLMGAYGVAILSLEGNNQKDYNLNIKDISFETKYSECKLCPNNCEILKIYKENKLVDIMGNRCEKGGK